MSNEKRERVGRVLQEALLPHAIAAAVVPLLKRTPEYEQARREKRSKAWLEAESLAIGRDLAPALGARLANLNAEAGR